jgi:xylan 1,4-beta-xylosidase
MHPERKPFLTALGSNGRLKRAGHGNIFTGPDGRDYITFLCARPLRSPEEEGKELSPLGRETGIAPVEWRNDWPYLSGASEGNIPPDCFEIPGAKASNRPIAERYEFGQLKRLPLELQSLRVPIDESWCSLSKDRPLFLRLYGRDSPASRFDQSLLARRVRHLSFSVETELEFYPRSHLQFAGLMARYDENSFYYLIVTHDDETDDLVLSYIETLRGDYSYIHRLATLANSPVVLKLESKECRLGFSFSQLNRAFQDCGIQKDLRFLSDENAYPIGFTGAFVGIAASDMLGQRTPADFSYFEYRALEQDR